MIRDDLQRCEVRPGMMVEAWRENLLVGAMRSGRPMPGLNTRVQQTTDAAIIHFDPPMPKWHHAFRVTLAGLSALVASGRVNGVEPLIDGVPLSGTERRPPPTLSLNEALYDDEGRSWLAIRAVLLNDEEPARLDFNRLTIIQSATVRIEAGGAEDDAGAALWPIAVLKRLASQTGGSGTLHQIVHFDLAHRYSAQGRRHFFYAAT